MSDLLKALRRALNVLSSATSYLLWRNRPKAGLDSYDVEGYVLDQDDSLIVHSNGMFCGVRGLSIVGITKSLQEMSVDELRQFIKTYFASLNLGFPIEIITNVEPIPVEPYLRSVERELDTAELIVESNPSFTDAKDKLRHLRIVKDNITKLGLQPLRITSYALLRECSPSIKDLTSILSHRASLAQQAFTSVGIKTRRLSSKSLINFLSNYLISMPRKKRRLFGGIINAFAGPIYASPSMIIFFPALMWRAGEWSSRFSGVLLGRNILTNTPVFWDLGKISSPHIVIVGPTGSGKTEFLANLVREVRNAYGSNTLIIDVKGEYLSRLLRKGVRAINNVLGRDLCLDFRNFGNLFPKDLRSSAITDLIVRGLGIKDPELINILYDIIDSELREEGLSFLRGLEGRISLYESTYRAFQLKEIVRRLEILGSGCGNELISTTTDFLIGKLRDPMIIDLSLAYSLDPSLVSLAVSALSRAILSIVKDMPAALGSGWKHLVLDEGWVYTKEISELVSALLRLGRSYKISVNIATQDLEDLRSLGLSVISNTGLLVAMPAAERRYWEELGSYMRINEEEITFYTSLLTIGECVIRAMGSPRGIPIKYLD